MNNNAFITEISKDSWFHSQFLSILFIYTVCNTWLTVGIQYIFYRMN